VAMPPGTPDKLAREMNAAFMKAMQSAEVQRYMRATGSEVVADPEPQALRQYAEAETVKWAAVIKQAGIQPQ